MRQSVIPLRRFDKQARIFIRVAWCANDFNAGFQFIVVRVVRPNVIFINTPKVNKCGIRK